MKFGLQLFLAAASLVFNVASAATVTIASPPEGLKLLLSGHETLMPGDPNWTMTGSSIPVPTVTPVRIADNQIIGMVSGLHSETQYTKNQFSCNSRESGGYVATMNVVGYQEKTCKNGSGALIVQKGEDVEASDVIITFSKE